MPVSAQRTEPLDRSSAANSFWVTHLALPLAAFVTLMIMFASTSIDAGLAHPWAYDDAMQQWIGRGRWWAEVLLHRDGRDAVLLFTLVLLATLVVGIVSRRARAARSTVTYVFVTIALG